MYFLFCLPILVHCSPDPIYFMGELEWWRIGVLICRDLPLLHDAACRTDIRYFESTAEAQFQDPITPCLKYSMGCLWISRFQLQHQPRLGLDDRRLVPLDFERFCIGIQSPLVVALVLQHGVQLVVRQRGARPGVGPGPVAGDESLFSRASLLLPLFDRRF